MMVDPTHSFEDLARHVRQHLESLKAAGVEWLPNAPPPTRPESVGLSAPRVYDFRTGASPVASRPGGSLFEEQPPLPPAGPPPDERRRDLAVLAEQVKPCMRCNELASTRTQTVFGVGRIDPDVC